jgi:4-alpha-glucanotransferase
MILSQTSARSPVPQPILRDAIAKLGIEGFVIAIHQASFPAGDDDLGSGTPYGRGGDAILELAASLGATGIMLGPAGVTSEDNPSPYDATALSRNPMHIAFGRLEPGLLDRELSDALAAEIAARPDRGAYRHAWRATRRLLAAIAARPELAPRLAGFRTAAPWLADEARYEGIAAALGHEEWNRWPADAAISAPVDRAAALAFEVGQLLVHDQHRALRARAAGLGLVLYGDVPIGLSHRDRWLRRGLFLPGYAMGAPPSRTNPDGQPWGYPVLDPAQLEGGAAHAFAALRLDVLLADHGGLRIDHPHGWICPWVYRTGTGDDLAAVQAGARLHESPAEADHPALAALARVRPDQIDRDAARHADDRVRWIEPAQLDRYAATFDLLMARAAAHGVDRRDLVIEVLSTCPRPLREVLARHRLGRFRVTQKARVDDPGDVYRGDRAAPEDWIMVGNHDTPPLRLVVDRWQGTAEIDRRAGYLAERLAGRGDRAALAARLAADPRAMTEAMFAELFLGPARHVQIFWADLFGARDVYNRPGVVDEANWSLRAPTDVAAAYHRAVASGDAPDLGRVLALALVARGLESDADGAAIVSRLRGA